MKRIFLTGVAAGAACVALAASAAWAQVAAPTPDAAVTAAPVAAAPAPMAKPKPKPKMVKPTVQPWIGSWTGAVQQVGRASTYPIEVTLTAKGGETAYPGQNCAGKLTKLGSTNDYAAFVEVIGTGKFDSATKAGCLDGSLTLERSADGVVMTWMTGYGGKAIVAYGSLMPKPK